MNGRFDWPKDRDIGGPYGYSVLIIQKDGFRLSCDGPIVPCDDYRLVYRKLTKVQKELVRKQPRSLDEAFAATRGAVLRKERPFHWLRRAKRALMRRFAASAS